MRRILVTAGLMAGLIGATTVPAAAQGWGYAAYDEPWGVGVRVGGVGVGIGAPAYGAYAADYGYAPAPGYAYSAATDQAIKRLSRATLMTQVTLTPTPIRRDRRTDTKARMRTAIGWDTDGAAPEWRHEARSGKACARVTQSARRA